MRNPENPENLNSEIPEMGLDNKYSQKPQISQPTEMSEEMEKTKKELEKLLRKLRAELRKL